MKLLRSIFPNTYLYIIITLEKGTVALTVASTVSFKFGPLETRGPIRIAVQ
jgi:hypothetical protein